jgi:hypothetical protein
VLAAHRRLNWLLLRHHWLVMWNEMDARFRKTVRSSPETIRAKPDHWGALIKSAELYQVNSLLYEALKRLPDDFVPNPFEVLGVWYVLVLSQCGASNEDLNHIRRRPRAWSEIVENKCRDYERKAVRRSGSL